jgi:hypothetical protein
VSEQNKDLVRRYYDQVINGRDLDAVGDYFADQRVAGWVRKGCFHYFQAFPDLHTGLDEFVAESDRVFLRSTLTGPRTASSKASPQQDTTSLSTQRRCPDRRRQVRRLLVHGGCRGADTPAHRGAGCRASITDEQRYGDAGAVNIPRYVGNRRCAWHARHAQRERPTQRGMFTSGDGAYRSVISSPSLLD